MTDDTDDASGTARRNPPWTWDEVVLACELTAENGWRSATAEDTRVTALSELLQRLPIHPPEIRGPDFRNPNGVARKTADIATRHPSYKGRPTNGGRTDRQVLQAFLDRPDEMAATARAIRQSVPALDVAWPDTDLDLDLSGLSAQEGRLLERRHLARERDPVLRRHKLDAMRRTGKPITCEPCGFDFAATYGERGRDYIEVHHRIPLHVSGATRTRLDDLVLVCSNCHRIIHRHKPWLTIEQLNALLTADHGTGQ